MVRPVLSTLHTAEEKRTVSVAAPTPLDLDVVRVAHLMDCAVELVPAQVVKSPLGLRLNYVLREGVAEGERVRGRFLPGGGDWIVVGSDGLGRIDIRATLETHDGELVYTTFTGLASIPKEVAARLAAGERARWDEVFMRSMARFETGAAQYTWLNSVFAVAVHDLGPSDADTWRVDHHIFELL
jgi:hypothetical protein